MPEDLLHEFGQESRMIQNDHYEKLKPENMVHIKFN